MSAFFSVVVFAGPYLKVERGGKTLASLLHLAPVEQTLNSMTKGLIERNLSKHSADVLHENATRMLQVTTMHEAKLSALGIDMQLKG